MLKHILFLASLFIFQLTFSQNAIVIDNTNESNVLFDSNDPMSLVSFIKSNAQYLGYMELTGLSADLVQTLTSEQKKAITPFIGKPGTVPLIDNDPLSANFGKYLIVTDPTTGMQSFVYDAPDTINTILSDIDRIVFKLKESGGGIWDRIETVEYWKILNGKYHKVMRVNGQELLSFDGFSIFKELDKNIQDKLTANTSESLWNAMREAALSQKKQYKGEKYNRFSFDLKNRYFPAAAIRFGFYNWSKGPAKLNVWEKERDVFFPRLSDEEYDQRFPFGLNLGKDLYKDTSGRAETLALFDEVHSAFENNDTPLIDEDPNSPNFGNYLIIQNEMGMDMMVYPDPKEVYFWLEYSDINIFIAESYHQSEGTSSSSIDAVYFTKNVDGIEEVVSVIPMSETLENYFGDYQSKSIENFGFYQFLMECAENEAYHFDLERD